MKTFFPVPTHPQVLATNFLKKTPGTPSYLFSLKVLPTSFESTKKVDVQKRTWMYKNVHFLDFPDTIKKKKKKRENNPHILLIL